MSTATGTIAATNLNIDMATALELPLGTELEAKFVALRNLQLKKIKKLMGAIDGKDKEIAKLKILSKDNRRTQLIQALRNKIKDLELINDIIKEELTRKAELETDEVNDLIIRKTLGGPKRFRPLSREELENKIVDLEKRLASAGNASNLRKSQESNADAKSERAGLSTAADSKPSGRTSSVAEGKNANPTSTDESKSAGFMSVPELINNLALIDEVQNLRNQLAAKDQQIGAQRDEIVRLRARNAELIALEEDMQFFEKEMKDARDRNEDLLKHVEQITRQLTAANETISKFKAENIKVLEEEQLEIEGLHKQCEKLLKQNATLLESLADAEQTIQRYEEVATLSKSKSASTENLLVTKDAKLKQLSDKNTKMEEKIRQLEERLQVVETEAQQVPALKDQLREKNIAIRDFKRQLETSAQPRPQTSTSNLLQSPAGAQAKLPSGGRSPSPERPTTATSAPISGSPKEAPAPSSPVVDMNAEAKEISRPQTAEKGQK
eukprot:gene3916-2781_t